MTVIARLYETSRRHGNVFVTKIVTNDGEVARRGLRGPCHHAGRIFGESLMYGRDNMGIGLRSA